MASSAAHPFRPAVVIPTYQRAGLIGRAIASAAAQEPPPAEIVVVDDGSTDGTEGVVRSFSNVRYVRQQNRGVSSARNAGVRATSSPWIAFLDSDDIWRPGHLANIAHAVAATDGSADLYFANARLTGGGSSEETWYERCGFTPDVPFEFTGDGFRWAMKRFQPMFLQASAIRREAWLAVGGLCEDLATREDTHLFFRLALNGAMCAVSHVGVEVTADSAPETRLTEVHRSEGVTYLRATVLLYEDILSTGRLPLAYRRELRRRLSDAHWRLARSQASHLRAASSLASAFSLDPLAVGARMVRRLGAARSH